MVGEYWGVTGKIIERELFGSMERQSENEIKEKMSKGRFYQSERDALEFVRKAQAFDVSDPAPDFANDLHATIAQKLDLDDYSQLEFYTAIGSYLDYKYGVDGFFEFVADPSDPESRIRITMDVTANPNKAEGYKADLIILVPGDGLDPKEDRDIWLDIIEDKSDVIVMWIKRQLEARKPAVA